MTHFLREEYRRQDFTALERSKFYSEAATEKSANGDSSNQISKTITMNAQELMTLALQLEPHEPADMAAALQDGSFLIVEYKGADR